MAVQYYWVFFHGINGQRKTTVPSFLSRRGGASSWKDTNRGGKVFVDEGIKRDIEINPAPCDHI